MTPEASVGQVWNPGGIPAAWLALGFPGQALFARGLRGRPRSNPRAR